MNNNWFLIDNVDKVDSPALVLYKERIEANIQHAIEMIRDVSLLRPHVKTNKCDAVCSMMMDAGITKFKCATIAEAEMLGRIEAPDVLLAYQPVGPKAERFLMVAKKYEETKYSCLVDDYNAAIFLSSLFETANKTADVFIDINAGQNRTGIQPLKALELFKKMIALKGINIAGLHAYDGHIRETNVKQRQQQSDEAYTAIDGLISSIYTITNKQLTIVAGGSPTYPTHIQRKVECSPGTFVYWDHNYKHAFPDEPFDYAALIVTRVISIVDATTITTDLGHKSVGAENPLSKRVYFLNADATPLSQSEEHLVLSVADSSVYKTGDVMYGVPYHICPTVALYDEAYLAENGRITDVLNILARKKRIDI